MTSPRTSAAASPASSLACAHPLRRRRMRLLMAGALPIACTLGLLGCAAAAPESGTEAAIDEAALAIDIDAMDLAYTDRDKDPSYDAQGATRIALEGATATVEGEGAAVEGAVVTIGQAGTYLVSGTLDDGQLVVDLPGAEDRAQVVLAGASIHNNQGAALYVKQADKVFLTLAEGSDNALSDGAAYELAEGEDEPNAALFSKDDLTINGSGSLAVTGSYRHAIHSKDDLVVTGGTFAVSAAEDGLRGKDCVKVLDGSFAIEAGQDGVKSSNDEDGTQGFVSIDGGTFAIDAGDDGIHAETALFASGGEVTVSSSTEGYEATKVLVSGGTHRIAASDDGVNASLRDTAKALSGATLQGEGAGPAGAMEGASEDCVIEVTGGLLSLDAQADGLDSNGSISVTGGTLVGTGATDGANAALDYETSATIDGGTVLLLGGLGMAADFTGGTQPFALVQAQGQAGATVILADGAGNELARVTAARAFQAANVSAPGLSEGDACQVIVDGIATQATVSTTSSAGMGAPGGAMAPGRGNVRGEDEEPRGPMEGFEPPEGEGGAEPPAEAPARPEAGDGEMPPAEGRQRGDGNGAMVPSAAGAMGAEASAAQARPA